MLSLAKSIFYYVILVTLVICLAKKFFIDKIRLSTRDKFIPMKTKAKFLDSIEELNSHTN